MLAKHIIESYATNEIGFVSIVNDEDVGRILPEVDVEVLNEQNEPVFEELGRIRLKSPAQIEGYIENETADVEMFQDGWFYPGDYGVMPDKQHMKLAGRKDDLINFCGVKRNTSEIEDLIRPHVDAEDFCVLGHLNEEMKEEIWIVVQPHSTTNLDELNIALDKLAPQTDASLQIKVTKNLPRTITGKIKRNELLQEIRSID